MVENDNGCASAENSDSENPFGISIRSQTTSAIKADVHPSNTPKEHVTQEVVRKLPRKRHQRRGDSSKVKDKQKRKAIVIYGYDDNEPSKKKQRRGHSKVKDKQYDDNEPSKKKRRGYSKVKDKQRRNATVVYDCDDDDDHEEFTVAMHSKKRMTEGKRDMSSELKAWDYYIRPEQHFRARIGHHTNTEVVKMLKMKLNETQINLFRETCFGYFLDLPDVVLQLQLIHSLLLREVFQERNDELWILMNGVRLRFGISEFALVTGLKCTGDAHKRHDCKESSRLIDTYFPKFPKVTKQAITDCFLDQRWTSDQDAVKIAILYFIHTFLFSHLPERSIGIGDFELIETGEYETYPWGQLVFNDTIKSLKSALRGTTTMYMYYRVYGFPLAFQCWFYECCPHAKDHIAFKVEDKVPRILSWKVTKQPNTSELSREIFNRKSKLQNIYPTLCEESKLDVLNFFENEKDKEVEDEDDAELYRCIDEFTDPPLNDVDWRDELKQLSVGQLELKEEVKLLNKEVASFKGYMATSFSNVFKAIESLSKNQGGKTAFELFEQLDTDGNDNSSGFDDDEGHINDDEDHGNDVMDVKEDSDKGNEGATEGTPGNRTNGVEGGEKTLADPVDEVLSEEVTQTVVHTCEGSSRKSNLKGTDPNGDGNQTNGVEGGEKTLADPVNEVLSEEVTRTVAHTCEGSSQKSNLEGTDPNGDGNRVNSVEGGGKTLADPVDEDLSEEVTQTVAHTCEGSSQKSNLNGTDPNGDGNQTNDVDGGLKTLAVPVDEVLFEEVTQTVAHTCEGSSQKSNLNGTDPNGDGNQTNDVEGGEKTLAVPVDEVLSEEVTQTVARTCEGSSQKSNLKGTDPNGDGNRTNGVEGGEKTLADPVDEVLFEEVTQTVAHTCEGSSQKSNLEGTDPNGDGIYFDVFEQFGGWVDQGTQNT